ncbi:Myb-like DNA-binding domain containing protein [Trichomonas vaginalis G3]|uniref:Myb-like DNA-binding domain containing protein n=1 Tax=Trichomonas vaginalis (strain ATCC PRA-98 / G3) TaxID=412133 RepID=A2FSN3_TRIV3|nr:Myb-like DNA-binding domain containing protein [Trichomonas vaginalis G3]|eukprot:XP_001305019.1 Myb-like DNA-binding domain containing protein [Trichomonas vaginalis G3]
MQVEETSPQEIVKTNKKKSKWTHEEDRILKEAVRICGPSKWDKIAPKIEGRTGKQCRERWLAFLDPNINNAPFSKEEDDLIYSLQQKYGNHWKKISAYLNGRTDISVENHWRSLRKKFGVIIDFVI